MRKALSFVLLGVFVLGLLAACAPQQVVQTVEVVKTVVVEKEGEQVIITATPAPEEAKVLSVYGIFATPSEEPWDRVIQDALFAARDSGRITYDFVDNLGYSGDLERVLQETAEQKKPDVIFGDAFGNEEAVRRVAALYPEIAFVFGSGLGPSEPNLSVFDNWIHEPAYLCGMLAGGMTKSNTLGVVAAIPVPEVNRLVNAFTAGALEVNPKVTVLTTFIGSWFDPAKAKEAALAQIEQGADVLYAERFGVHEAAKEKGVWMFGNMSDQNELAPDLVISSPVWNMGPTVDYVLTAVAGGTYTAQDLKDFSMMAKGGASLAPFHGTESKLPADLVAKVKEKEQQIQQGLFRVDIDERQPPERSQPLEK